jgi:hypothetical protein
MTYGYCALSKRTSMRLRGIMEIFHERAHFFFMIKRTVDSFAINSPQRQTQNRSISKKTKKLFEKPLRYDDKVPIYFELLGFSP